jgi:ubiquitin-conjugating enzyme E2 W
MKLAKANSRAARRIQKELEKFQEEAVADGLELSVPSIETWYVSFVGPVGTLYEGERYTLRIRFTEDYPMDSPEVTFEIPAPVHSHIYSNGHICLNILGDDWSPALTAKSVCLSILSMLSSATVKILPQDNDRYVSIPRSTPKNTRFMYHDDTV